MVKPTIIYDAECRLCVSTQHQIARWDRHNRINFISYQDPEMKRRYSDISIEACSSSIHFIDEAGKTWIGAEAFREILRFLPGGLWFRLLYLIPGGMWIAKKIYRWTADHRYQLLGRLSNPFLDPNASHRERLPGAHRGSGTSSQ
jgi:predicted DCC family thiol-disulfide oxidoreductase YuxK